MALERTVNRAANSTLEDLERRLRHSAAYDGSENQSHAYGHYADDINPVRLEAVFAKKGHKAAPFGGYCQTPQRITGAMQASHDTNRSALRYNLSFHCRPQSVILVSGDGKSTTLRATVDVGV
jgi:hypothetical protein